VTKANELFSQTKSFFSLKNDGLIKKKLNVILKFQLNNKIFDGPVNDRGQA
jgi:hypothetical protein